MAGEGLFLTMAVAYGLVAIVKRAAKTAQQQRAKLDMSGVSGGRSRAPQTMEELLQEMRGQLDGAKRHQEIEAATVRPGQGKRPLGGAVKRLPPAERDAWDQEEGQSLEEEARPNRTREIVVRAQSAPIDYDNEAETLVARRIVAAQLRNGAINPEDHRRFDAAIRTTKPVAVPAPETRARALRRAMIWHEVLSPPRSLRDGD